MQPGAQSMIKYYRRFLSESDQWYEIDKDRFIQMLNDNYPSANIDTATRLCINNKDVVFSTNFSDYKITDE